MKYTCSVIINAPINKVVKWFDNKVLYKDWQKGFVRMEHLAGKPGTEGAESKMTYKSGKGLVTIKETILSKNLPAEITALYEHTQMDNTMKNRFVAISDGQTQLQSEIEYLRFRGFSAKAMALLMPGAFKKQTQEWIEGFKEFVEKGK